MAEAVVSIVVQRITDLIIQESNFLQGVNDEVEQLKVELQRMRCLLKDADRRQGQDHRVQNWVAEIRNLAYNVEDVIDIFLAKIMMARRQSFIKKPLFMFSKPFYLHQIKTQINSVKDKLANISTNMQTYGIKLVTEGEESIVFKMQRRMRRSYAHMEEDHVISFDSITRELKTQVMKEEDQRCVIAIVGMGGIGKTTLARKIFNDTNVKQHFDCYCWVFISQQFSMKDVIAGILMEVMTREEKSRLELENHNKKLKREKIMEEQLFKSVLQKMKEDELVIELHKVLEEKRYLVVLDDIWTREAWDCLTPAFPRGKKGSKVLLTTRNREVALHADPRSPLMEPPLLEIDDGWILLSRKALIEDSCAPKFEKLGKEMVKKCGGLPLAIVVLGGLLATKKSVKEWDAVQRSVNAHFTKLDHDHPYGGVYGILSMSYDDLPFHLKPCFLHLSQFPEDSDFHKRRLIRLWIAEGFISQPYVGENDRTMEDVGEEYLEELVSRCLVQVRQRDHTGVGVKTCRMHDLVRDVCISKARDENFLQVVEHMEKVEANSRSSDIYLTTSNFRRIAIHSHRIQDSKHKAPVLKNADPHLRSLLYFVDGNGYYLSRKQVKFILKNYKLIRVLNLENIFLREIRNLIHLRYLELRNCRLYNGDLIRNLRGLYTLDLRGNSRILRLHKVLSKLECLRHLLVEPHHEVLVHNWRHLETLKLVSAKSLIRENGFQDLMNLRKLGVKFCEEAEIEIVLESPIFQLGRLYSLDMMHFTKSFIAMESLSGCQHLTKLKLHGCIHGNIECLPTSLAKLFLSSSKLEQDPMEKLAKFPNLRILSLLHLSYKGSKMVCPARGFPLLETLELFGLYGLEQWEIEEDAMPCLKTLLLGSLKKLTMIPDGLKFVTTLQDLNIFDMEFIKRRVEVRDGIEGDDFHKVRHIASISFQGWWSDI